MESVFAESTVVGVLGFLLFRLIERQAEQHLRYIESVIQLTKHNQEIAAAVDNLSRRIDLLEKKHE